MPVISQRQKQAPVMYCYVYLSVVSDCEGDGPISEGLFQAYSVAESVKNASDVLLYISFSCE